MGGRRRPAGVGILLAGAGAVIRIAARGFFSRDADRRSRVDERVALHRRSCRRGEQWRPVQRYIGARNSPQW
jgi:hypothetical protein